jgi:light-regulated signal transduction histidine kinase (bacteriophytochrome)
MNAAAPCGNGMESLRTAAGLCLASPLAACIVLPDGRLHVFNEPYRALVSAHDGLTRFASPWPQPIAATFADALAGSSMLVESQIASHTVTLSLIPVREDGTNAVRGVFVSVIEGTASVAGGTAAQQFDAFRYTLAHDLLSPLRTLQEMARILEREHTQHLPPDASIFLGHFSQGTTKLAERVEALIRLVRLNSQPLNCHRVDVARMVNDIVTGLRATYGDEATVVVGKLPDLHGDADLVRELFTELLSNAFKFSRETREPRIEIGSAVSDDGQNTYFVMDNGTGFDMKYAGKLFGLFQRMHGEAQFEGTGAGLAIARRIVERHGGVIRAEAMKDQGAKFIFTLPPARSGARPDA